MLLKQQLSNYMNAGFPILYIDTFEEAKVEDTIRQVADRRTVCSWSMANGYGEYSTKTNEWLMPPTKDESTELVKVLEGKLAMDDDLHRTILLIKDAHIVLENLEVVAYLKEIAIRISRGLDCCVILLSPVVTVPVELEKYITLLENDYQNFEDICGIINRFIEEQGLDPMTPKLLEDMAVAFKGLSEFEINSLLALAASEDAGLNHKHLSLIFEQKKQIIRKSGILEMVPVKERIDDIGGLEILKQWLKRKAKVIQNMKDAENFGVDMPKGVLIAGVPGCGKSLCAKAAASLFEVPILRLDVGKLMGKYLGESESNLRKAIHLAEAIAPCVLWVDELEKAFAGMGSEGGHEVTTRLFGAFLTWMQEKTSAAFVVATANDITKLPPELLRKGRFDEIFFVGLPTSEERRKIFEIHIAKRRKQDMAKIRLSDLVAKTEGYSGADIEGVVKEAVECAFADGKDAVTTEDILAAIKNTNSLSVIMKEPLEKMKKEYEQRKLKNASR